MVTTEKIEIERTKKKTRMNSQHVTKQFNKTQRTETQEKNMDKTSLTHTENNS